MKKNLDNVRKAAYRPLHLEEIFDMPFLGNCKLWTTYSMDLFREFTLYYGSYIVTNNIKTVDELTAWLETKEAQDRRWIFGNPIEFNHLYLDYTSMLLHKSNVENMQKVLDWIWEEDYYNINAILLAYGKFVTFDID